MVADAYFADLPELHFRNEINLSGVHFTKCIEVMWEYKEDCTKKI